MHQFISTTYNSCGLGTIKGADDDWAGDDNATADDNAAADDDAATDDDVGAVDDGTKEAPL